MIGAVSKPLKIDGLKLPPAPQTLIQLIEVCHRDDADFDELHRIISRDAALVSRILTVAHSAAFAQWRELGDLRRLLVVLGTDTVRSLALTAAVQQFFSSFQAERSEFFGRQWMDALICSQLCRRLVDLLQYPEPELAWLAGLLHRVGRLILLDNDPDGYPRLIEQAVDPRQQLRLEQKQYGVDSCELAAQLVEQWGEPELADALRFQYHPASSMQDSSLLVKLLNRSAQWTLVHDEPDQATLEDGLFGLQQPLLLDLLSEAVCAAVEDARSFSISTDDRHYPSEPLDNEQTRLQLARQIQGMSLLQASETGLILPEEPKSLLRQLQKNLRLLLGFPRSLALLPSEDQQQLLGIDDEIEGFEIQLQSGRSRVADCALGRQMQPIHPQGEDSPAVIDLQLLERLGRDHALCVPLVAEGQLQGLLLIGFDADEKLQLEERRGLIGQLARRVAILLLRFREQQQEREQALEQERMEMDYRNRELAHEIKNPLTTIRNYLELLSRQVQDAGAQPHIDTIKSEIDRVGKLLRQLSGPGEELAPEAGQAVDVNRLIERLIELYRPTLRAIHDIRCELQLDPKLPLQQIDRNRLKQILTNLLRNAAEALPPGGQVRIETRYPVIVDGNTFFEIAVADNGPGIDAELLPKLFTPVATTKGADHAGLGLSIVHRLVQELGGSIRYGQSPLGGAEFTLLLPLQAAHNSSPASGTL